MTSCKEINGIRIKKRTVFDVRIDIQEDDKRADIVEFLESYKGVNGAALFHNLAFIIKKG